MKRWGKYSWRSDETKLISAILEVAKKSEGSEEVARVESSERKAPQKFESTAKELHSSRTGAR